MLVYHLPGTFQTREPDLDLLWEAGATGLEERAGAIRVYFSERVPLPPAVADGEWHEEPDQDWQAEFRRTLRPVRAGRVTIVAPWQREEVEDGQLSLVIEPGMAFGTGTHPTTRLSIELIERHLPPAGAVLDIGTGSGILLLAAAKLGAGRLAGCDRDAGAVQIARRNLARNGIDPRRAALVQADLGRGFRGRFDLIAANLLNVVLEIWFVYGLELGLDGSAAGTVIA